MVIGREMLDAEGKSLAGWRDDFLGDAFAGGESLGPHVNIPVAVTVADWGLEIVLWEDIRATLAICRPAIFEQELDQLGELLAPAAFAASPWKDLSNGRTPWKLLYRAAATNAFERSEEGLALTTSRRFYWGSVVRESGDRMHDPEVVAGRDDAFLPVHRAEGVPFGWIGGGFARSKHLTASDRHFLNAEPGRSPWRRRRVRPASRRQTQRRGRTA